MVIEDRDKFELEPGTEEALTDALRPGAFIGAPTVQLLLEYRPPVRLERTWIIYVGGLGLRQQVDGGLHLGQFLAYLRFGFSKGLGRPFDEGASRSNDQGETVQRLHVHHHPKQQA